MAHNDFKRYVWLVDLLGNSGGSSFADIDKAWQNAGDMNPDGKPLPVRTFYNHIEAVRSVFGIDIRKSGEDRLYRIIPGDDIYADRMQETLMSILSLNRTVNLYKDLKGRILYEDGSDVCPEWMRTIVRAMNEGRKIRLAYRKYGEDAVSSRNLSPYCLKMFKHRWYLLAKEDRSLKTFALDDRTENVEVLESTFKFPEDFNAESHFRDVFGIRSSPAKRVVLKAYGNEVDYLRSVPLHPSQKEEEAGDGYAVFSIFVGIDAWEFYQEILSRGDRLEILLPKTLREGIAACIEKMRRRYAE